MKIEVQTFCDNISIVSNLDVDRFSGYDWQMRTEGVSLFLTVPLIWQDSMWPCVITSKQLSVLAGIGSLFMHCGRL